MADLPAGTVTFLFTDVEGSTRLLNELGDGYAELLADHRRALRDVFARHDGAEVDTQGDAFFVAFARARDAAAAASDAQSALADSRVRVRIGLHTGEPLLTADGYVGIDVHRAARIAAAGHGGQVLMSQSTRDLVGEVGDVRDLGKHRLRDLTAAEHIYQLGDAMFPSLKTLDRTSLPTTATSLVGRERELGELIALLQGEARLVTVTGAGGSGKTRLALQVAAELADDYTDGVFFVSLASVRDPALVGPAIAQVTEVQRVEDLRELEVLLVLDNFEHLLPAATEVSHLLAVAPRAKLIATSRVRLHLSAELEYPLEPLTDDEAVAFFVERARAVNRDVRSDAAVGEICRRLDGLPLALELAASRVKVLDPALLLERLNRRLPVLTGGARDAPERQQTLRATIEWSYELLETRLQEVFRRLAVFGGSFSVEATEAVTGADLDEIAALVDWNLLKPIGDGRVLMLETIREFAREALERNGEADEVGARNLVHVLSFVERAEPELTRADQREWYERLALEQANVREALTFACDSGDGDRALMLSGTNWRFWWSHANYDEADHWYARAFAVGERTSPRARGRALFGWAHVPEARDDARLAQSRFAEAAELFRGLDDTRWLVLALAHQAIACRDLGERERSDSLMEEALALALEAGDVRGAAVVRGNQGGFLLEDGNVDGSAAQLEQALEGSRAVGDGYLVAACLVDVAAIQLLAGDVGDACRSLDECLELLASLANEHDLVLALAGAAAALHTRGDLGVSAQLYGAAEALARAHGRELHTPERAALERLREVLGDDFEPFRAQGAELEPGEATALARRALTS